MVDIDKPIIPNNQIIGTRIAREKVDDNDRRSILEYKLKVFTDMKERNRVVQYLPEINPLTG
ncbi:hypothetical protein [Breoghania sp.]|uniref:hypothetical protein n=1 Tax=Breoghania sp. TaxID=2065378 RepID=UPI002AA5E866|nr:hypothetical protein [Breoghania sp.]